MLGTAPRCTFRDDGAVALDVEASMNDDSYCEVVAVSVSSEDAPPSSTSSSIKRFRLDIVNNRDKSNYVVKTIPTHSAPVYRCC